MSAPRPSSTAIFWLIVLALAALTMTGCSASSPDEASRPSAAAAPAPAPAAPGPFVDETTLHRSTAPVFLARFEQVMKDDSKVNNWDDACHLKAGVYLCGLEVDGPLWLDDTWAYNVRVDGATGCWSARTADRFGANQAAIDEWRNRESLPSLTDEADVRRMVREANALRNLDGCVEQLPAYRHAGGHATRFMAGLASIDVQSKYPGAQRRTACRYKGKDVVDFAPDSHDFSCTTTLANARRYVSKLSCIEDPPYDDYGPCGQEPDYPRLAPRPLP